MPEVQREIPQLVLREIAVVVVLIQHGRGVNLPQVALAGDGVGSDPRAGEGRQQHPHLYKSVGKFGDTLALIRANIDSRFR